MPLHNQDNLNQENKLMKNIEIIYNRINYEFNKQLAAVRAALGAVSRVILKDHLEHCIVHAVESNDQAAIDELEHAIDKLIR